MQTNEAIALWKELGITSATMEFSCGGDGYGFSGTFYDLTGLLDGIKELLNQ